MCKIIEELWYGNIVPQENSVNNSTEMNELMKHIDQHHDDLKKELTSEQNELLEKYRESNLCICIQARRKTHS